MRLHGRRSHTIATATTTTTTTAAAAATAAAQVTSTNTLKANSKLGKHNNHSSSSSSNNSNSRNLYSKHIRKPNSTTTLRIKAAAAATTTTAAVNGKTMKPSLVTIAKTMTKTTTTASNHNKTENLNDVDVDNDGDDDDDLATTTAVEMRSTTTAHFRAYNTLRSNSTSAIMLSNGSDSNCCRSLLPDAATTAAGAATVATGGAATLYTRPRTLNVHNARHTPTHQTQVFFGEVLNAWRAKARCNVVSDERTQELFHELSFHPSREQISEMLQTAKKVARKGSSQANGLTFGQFCVLAADLKRFRASTISNACNFSDVKFQLSSSLQATTSSEDTASPKSNSNRPKAVDGTTYGNGTELRSTKSFSSVEDTKKKKNSTSEPVEVFLGGSCNPTTWRADVAIPALKELGISFYNPQVSDWTPDLIELEHRAKEKARVLFFVMDSETRASAGAIEAAHIAGQNCKQLVLVLHPYKPQQRILNEPISEQEYLDLTRNQMMLRELVTRRGLPVLDNIPLGLQRTKEILSGKRDPPTKISSILDVVRGAFDRVNPHNDRLTIAQCQRALLLLGYAQSLLNLDNLNKIIINQRESLKLLHKAEKQCPPLTAKVKEPLDENSINFELFCVVSAYLSVLQQEIHESGCISPIKGTNVPPPPVYFTNAPDVDIYYSTTKNISRNSSNASVPSNSSSSIGSSSNDSERQSLYDLLSRSRDSGTSSPQPQLERVALKQKATTQQQQQQPQILLNVESIETTEIITTKTIETTPTPNATVSASASAAAEEEEIASIESDDSNDSVFSSSSSIASATDAANFNCLELRDVYLGGSCALRTKWRENIAIPYFNSKTVSFHLPALHESLQQHQLQQKLNAAQSAEAAKSTDNHLNEQQQQQRSFVLTRRKCRGAQLQLEEQEELTVAEETWSWSLPTVGVRTNLYNPVLLDSSRVLLFVITNETRSLAPMTLAAHCIGLMYNVVLAVQMLPDDCIIGNEKLTPAAVKDYNRGRAYLIDLAKRQGVPVFHDIQAALDCTVAKIQAYNNRKRCR